ncbi:MAG: ROK family protein [Gammaproteobacteria bacterium]|nr:ROK family protein [Gammaproteobacteria bacterium]
MRIGIDLGGSKIEGVALDAQGNECWRNRVATPQGDYRAIIVAISELLQRIEQATGTTRPNNTIGIGMPGTIASHSGLIKNSNTIVLNGQAFLHDLETHLQQPVRISNDANCFALSEATDGAAVGASVVFGVIIGTGTGAGVVVNGHVLQGPNGIAGEWGHNPLPWPRDDERPGRPCYCGQYGCLETFLSGPGCAADFYQLTGESLAAEQIVALAAVGEMRAETVMRRYVDRMARGLAHVINILDPDVIVLGGGMSNIARLYTEVPALWGSYVFSDQVNTRLLPPRHGDASGVRGAACLWDKD